METHDKSFTRENIAFILDDQILFAESFASLLKTMQLFKHVFKSDNVEDMFAFLKTNHITHLFLDYNITGLNTSELLKIIKNINPGVHIIIIGSTENIFLIRRMLNVKAGAFITKYTGTVEIDMCMNAIKMGRIYIAKDIRDLLEEGITNLQPLYFTEKEIQVLQFIAKGYTIEQTANALHLSKHTIVAHRRKIMNKSGLNTATGLVKFAFEAGLIDVS